MKLCEPALVDADPTVTALGNYEQVSYFLVDLQASHLMYYFSWNLEHLICLSNCFFPIFEGFSASFM